MEYVVKIAITLFVIYIYFEFYYAKFYFIRSLIWQSKAFFLGLLASAVVPALQLTLPQTGDDLVRAFLYAATVEETVRYLILYFRIRYSSDRFSVTEGIFDSVLVGLGFAFAENLHYAVEHSGTVILLRGISSIPMHVFTSGIMGFYLSYRSMCDKNHGQRSFILNRRLSLGILALGFPILYHGLYDYFLFLGGNWNYMLGPLLIAGFGVLEYLVLRGHGIFGKNILRIIGVDADEQEILLRQKDYENWINNFNRWEEQRPSLFWWKWTPRYTGLGFLLILSAFVLEGLDLYSPGLFFKNVAVESQARFALLFHLPVMTAFILLISDKINFIYLRQYLMRLPIGLMPELIHKNGEVSTTVIMDLHPRGVFLAAYFDSDVGDEITMIFSGEKKSVRVKGRILWKNTSRTEFPIGSLVGFESYGIDFVYFRFRYMLTRLQRRFLAREI